MKNDKQIKRIVKAQEDIIEKIGIIKFTRTMIRTYNQLCLHCRLKLRRNPKMSIEHYCNNCKTIVTETLEKIIK